MNNFGSKLCSFPLIELVVIVFCSNLHHFLSTLKIMPYNLQLLFGMFTIYTTFYWSTSLVCDSLDKNAGEDFKKRHKISSERKEPKLCEMFPTLVFNQVVQFSFFTFLFAFFTPLVNLHYDIRRENVLNMFLSLLGYLLAYDIFFYFGHLAMHEWKGLYRSIHKLHHGTFATTGASAHYMHFADFFLESILPGAGLTSLLLLPSLKIIPGFVEFHGFSHCAFLSFNCVAAFHTVWTHSGWKFPFFPDPTPHFVHHHKQKYNLGSPAFYTLYLPFSHLLFSTGTFISDYVFNTSRDYV